MTTYTATTEASLNGLFKQVYGDSIVDAIPRTTILQKNIRFDASKRLGDFYNVPVMLQDEQGATYGGQSGTAYTINPAIPMQTSNAQVRGSSFIINGILSYDAASRAIEDGAASFASATSLQIENMVSSHAKRREIEMLYGAAPTGLGTGSAANVNTTTLTWTPATGQWSYLWVAMKGAQLDAYASGSKLNTNASLVISQVNVTAKTLTLTGNATDITAIDTQATGVVLFFFGAFGNEMSGVDAISVNTGSLFGINATTYDQWLANTFNVSGDLTYQLINTAVAIAQGRGLDEDVDLLVSSLTWKFLNDNVIANRVYDKSYDPKSAATGSQELLFNTQSGVLRVHSHNYVKEGEAFLLPFDRFIRVGSSDITFNIPGSDDGRVFRQLETQAGYEVRSYSDFAIMCETPAKIVKLFGITNA